MLIYVYYFVDVEHFGKYLYNKPHAEHWIGSTDAMN